MRKGFTLIEMLVVIAIIGVLAAMLAGPLMNARTTALITTCSNNLGQLGKAVFQYQSPNYFDKAPIIDDKTGTAMTDNKTTANPFVCLWRANLIDSVRLVACPAGSSGYSVIPADDAGSIKKQAEVSPPAASNATANLIASSTNVMTEYLFTIFYTKGSKGSRVIAGDAGDKTATTNVGFSPNHGDTNDPTGTNPTRGANAVFADTHVKTSTPGYTVEGAERFDGVNSDRNLWYFDDTPFGTKTAGTSLGHY